MTKQSVVPLSLDPAVIRIDLAAVRHQLTTSPQAIMSPEEWPAAELEYRQFLTLRLQYPGRLLIPAGRSLAVWQAHILDTRAYRADCETAFGRYIDHFPFFGQHDPIDQLERDQAVRDYIDLLRRHFAGSSPEGLFVGSPTCDGVGERIDVLSARRRIVLVGLPWQREGHQAIPLGHASILARLNAEPALDVLHIVRPVNDEEVSAESVAAEIVEMIHEHPPQDVDVAFGVYVWNEDAACKIIHLLRAHGFRGRIILGGPQITYADAGLEDLYPGVDAFIRGAGEEALCALACNDNPAAIRGVHLAGTPDRLEQAEPGFQNMPSPWLTGVLDARAAASMHWESQRGCQFRCSFCQHRQRDSRFPTVTAAEQRLAREIELFCGARPERISVLDPVFNRDEEHAAGILTQFIEHGFGGEISLQCRAELINLKNPVFLDAAEKLNVTLEFGLQSVEKREFLAVGRPNNLPKIEKVFDEVRRRGIRHEVSLIYGLPEQTVDSFRSTVDWCLRRCIPVVRAFPLLLLRGTDLYHERARWQLAVRDGLLPVVISSSTFDESDWREMDAIANTLADAEGDHPASLRELMQVHRRRPAGQNNSQLRALGRLQ